MIIVKGARNTRHSNLGSTTNPNKDRKLDRIKSTYHQTLINSNSTNLSNKKLRFQLILPVAKSVAHTVTGLTWPDAAGYLL